jgi:hypothetical protein
MLKQILDGNFDNYDFLGHTLIVDREQGDIRFEEFKSGPDDKGTNGLSRKSLDFLAQIAGASRDATHVHLSDLSRRVCIEGKHGAMENYTAYSVAYFKEKSK